MDLVDQNLTPWISSLPLSTPKGKNKYLLSVQSRVGEELYKGSFAQIPSELKIIANNPNISIQHM